MFIINFLLTIFHSPVILSVEAMHLKRLSTVYNERFAKSACRLMRYACYLVMLFYTLCLVLVLLGRLSFSLHTESGYYENAIVAETNHAPASRSFTVSTADSLHVWANGDGQIDWTIQAGLIFLYAVNIVPLLYGFWLLSRVFANVAAGRIFTEQNAGYLFSFGCIQFAVALFVPFLKLLICYITNLFADGRISIGTGSEMLSNVFPSIAFFVAAYIIHYGIHLQDEVDHTL